MGSLPPSFELAEAVLEPDLDPEAFKCMHMQPVVAYKTTHRGVLTAM